MCSPFTDFILDGCCEVASDIQTPLQLLNKWFLKHLIVCFTTTTTNNKREVKMFQAVHILLSTFHCTAAMGSSRCAVG